MCTFQFIPVEKRQKVVDAIYSSLKPGSGFILVEKLRISNKFLSNVWKTAYFTFKRKQGLTREMITEKEKRLEGVLIPITYQENLRLLTNGGFSKIEPFFMWFNFCGFVAVKT